MFSNQSTRSGKVPQSLEVGSFRVLILLLHLIDESAGMKRHGRVQFLAADLAALELPEEKGRSREISEVHSRKVSDEREFRQETIRNPALRMTRNRVDCPTEPC